MSTKNPLNLLIVFGTTEGQTRKIAERAADFIRASGHRADVFDSTAISAELDIGKYDSVIALGSVHQGHYQSSLIHFINAHLDLLQAKPSAFLSVSLSVAFDDDNVEAQQYVERLSTTTGWHPHYVEHVAGALVYTQYDFFKRQIMKFMARHAGAPSHTDKDYEFTDWDALQRFIDRYCELVKTAAAHSIN